MDNGLLLFPVAALHVEAADEPHWFRRAPSSHAAIISDFGDVTEVLARVPESWCVAYIVASVEYVIGMPVQPACRLRSPSPPTNSMRFSRYARRTIRFNASTKRSAP
ncbi:hypothetical protein F6X39_33130 [Paraburkholderia sp. UCT2]|nr:hypothetical protein [Paraburkholderia sp. UCT2]